MSDKQKLKLSMVSPVIQTDGNAIGINDDKTSANLVFFQVSNTTDEGLEARSVAVLRFDIEQLKQLADSIQETIEKIEPSEEKKES